MTTANQDVVDAIVRLTKLNGKPPTIPDLCTELGRSLTTVRERLAALRTAGRVRWKQHVANSISVIQHEDPELLSADRQILVMVRNAGVRAPIDDSVAAVARLVDAYVQQKDALLNAVIALRGADDIEAADTIEKLLAEQNNGVAVVKKEATPAQMRVLNCIKTFAGQHKKSPNKNEICEILGIGSMKTLDAHLAGLEYAGLIKRILGRARGIVVLG